MSSDDEEGADREAILARRNRFVAIALASLSTTLSTTAGCDGLFRPCLDVAPPPGQHSGPEDVEPEPPVEMEPLTAAPPNTAVTDDEGEAPTDDEIESGSSMGDKPTMRSTRPPRPPRPQVCLTPVRPPPSACLNVLLNEKPGSDPERDDVEFEG